MNHKDPKVLRRGAKSRWCAASMLPPRGQFALFTHFLHFSPMTDSSEKFARTFCSFVSTGQDIALRDSILEKARDSAETKRRFFEENADAILHVSREMANAFHKGGKLLVCGNGGSAADAQHIAVEFMHPVTVGRKALPAMCL